MPLIVGGEVLTGTGEPIGAEGAYARPLRFPTSPRPYVVANFVQSIDGVSGDRSSQRDWFYFVNGYEADRGAADYTLHPGDVEWWDYRAWKHAIHVPVVVGAFPEPFLHGYSGKTRAASEPKGG